MKRLPILIASVILAITVEASTVSQKEASALAASFLKQSEVVRVPSSFDYLYVFNGDNCFVILSADDRVLPVLGYSRDRSFDAEALPENAMEWLRSYNSSIQNMVETGAEASDEVREAWTALKNGEGLPQRIKGAVNPLITTQWNQRPPYNGLCPPDCYTGCVATAMAQIMKYWEYPNRGIGEYSYSHSVYGTLYANFGATSYDWDNMPSKAYTWSSEQVQQALSTLMYHCGVSVNMNYGTSGSSAPSAKVLEAMPAYFGYSDSISLVYQYDYSDEEWKSVLRDELDGFRPLYYAGQSDKGAHAFICDGYDDMGLFHFNWGWGGSYDGYYLIGALNPGPNSTYNNVNYAIIGIQPKSFTVSAPTWLSATVENEGVSLSWNGVNDASGYKVYRDDELIAPNVEGTSYMDTSFLPYGNYSYYLKAFNADGDRSPKSEEMLVDVVFHAPAPLNLDATLSNEAVELTWEMPFNDSTVMSYGMEQQVVSGYGYVDNCTYWGQYYPVEKLMEFAGLSISKVRIYVRNTGDYTLYLGKGDASLGMIEEMYQKTYAVDTTGWYDLVLDMPLRFDFSSGLWVILNAPISVPYPAAYSFYDGEGVEYASFISYSLSWFASHVNDSISWLIRVGFTDEAFTYSVSRNGALLASGLTEKSFVDSNISSGSYDYQVWAVCDSVDSKNKADYSIGLATIGLAMNNAEAGVVQGDGLGKIGEYHTVKAVPNAGNVFIHWTENDVVVSSDPEYSFVVEGDRQLTAWFYGTGVDEGDDVLVVRKVEVFTLTGVKLMTLDGTDLDWKCRINGFAKGVYLLRLTTDKGVVTKKIVISE